MQLIARETTIPVPRLISSGVHQDGRRYLITERIDGFPLDDLLREGCPMPEGQKHTDEIPCQICKRMAYTNALEFIRNTVIPQLMNLKSRERGICGFVMPPSWLTDSDPPWKGKGLWKTYPLEKPEYVFQHGDLAAHNILMDRQTLEVAALIDWEYAGFFPAGMERWANTLDKHTYIHRGDNVADAIAEFVAEEYLECYEQYDDKAELVALIDKGQLPTPRQLWLACGRNEEAPVRELHARRRRDDLRDEVADVRRAQHIHDAEHLLEISEEIEANKHE